MASLDELTLRRHLAAFGRKLSERAFLERVLDRYYEGRSPLPDVIVRAKVTRAYMLLMNMSQAPWGSLVVDSVLDRLEVTGVMSDDPATDELMWRIWQDQQLDQESALVHKSTLVSGRSFGMVWPDPITKKPQITFDGMGTTIVQYEEGNRRSRQGAMRYWFNEATMKPECNLYFPDYIYKFEGERNVTGPDGVEWLRRDAPGEPWPLPNPFGFVPIVEFPINRRLKPGVWGYARGEFEHVTSVIDKVNLLTFLGLVVSFWEGFPHRFVIGTKALRDKEGNVLPPFDVMANEITHIEDPNAKLDQFQAADRNNLSIFSELSHLAALTKTPITYFPHAGSTSNISADALRAIEGGLVSKIPAHKASLSEAWEELLRMAGSMLDPPIVLDSEAQLLWTDHTSSSLAERALAASQLVNVLSPIAIAEYALNATPDQMARWAAADASGAFNQILKAATSVAPVPGQPNEAPEPAIFPAPATGSDESQETANN